MNQAVQRLVPIFKSMLVSLLGLRCQKLLQHLSSHRMTSSKCSISIIPEKIAAGAFSWLGWNLAN